VSDKIGPVGQGQGIKAKVAPENGRRLCSATMDNEWESYKLLSIPLFIGTVVVVDRLMKWRAAPRQPLPPGPKPKFLLGNLFDLPRTFVARTYMEWGKQYNSESPVFSITCPAVTVFRRHSLRNCSRGTYRRSQQCQGCRSAPQRAFKDLLRQASHSNHAIVCLLFVQGVQAHD